MTDGPTLVGGRYELRGLLGRGGMAEVHEGFDLRLGRLVAVKQLSAQLAADPTAQARFGREARAAASLNHPNIASVFDTGEDIDPETGMSVPYIVMELVEGSTLRAVLNEDARLPPERAFSIIRSVLEALGHSHAAGIIHRDIKPANVMITPTGAVKVMDFGIARAVDDTSASLTQTAAVIGTAQYLSPEQASGKTVDQRSDLYSTGCLLFELLAGRAPFVGETSISVAYQHVREEPIPPSELNPDLSPAVDAVVLKSLRKDLDDRYQSADEMKADVDLLLTGSAGPTQVRSAPEVPSAPNVPLADGPLPDAPTAEAVVAPPPMTPPSGPGTALHAEPGSGRTGRAILVTITVLLLLGLGALGLYRLLKPAGASVAVPDVVGRTRAEADAELRKARLIPRFDSVRGKRDDTLDTVVEQRPAKGESVEAGSVVTLQINVGPAKAKIPDNLVGKDVDGVKQKLAAAGFTDVGTEAVRDDTGRARPGEVLSIDPAEGESVALDREIVIRYARGKASAGESTSPSTEKTADPQPTATTAEPTKTDEPTDEPVPSTPEEPSRTPEPTRSAKSSGSPRSGKSKPTKTSKSSRTPDRSNSP